MSQKYFIIVAGGSGSRMGTATPKQFLEINNIPILFYTISNFFAFDNTAAIILVLPENQIAFWEQLCADKCFTIPHKVVEGGAERFFSVKNALDSIPTDTAIVAVHDGVRPFVSHQTISSTILMAEQYGAAIPAISLKDSIRYVNNELHHSVDRSLYKLIQTPQCFDLNLLKKAYNQPFKSTFTDDASVVESIGVEIKITDGNDENIKITSPSDLIIATALVNANLF